MDNKVKNDAVNEYLKKVSDELWVRLINNIFGENFDLNDRLTQKQSKLASIGMDVTIEIVVADILITIDKSEDEFHIELQTANDSAMVFRMMEYGTNCALNRMSSLNKNEFKFPRQAVIFIEKNTKIKDYLECKIEIGKGNNFVYRIPTVKVFKKETSKISDDLLLLLPFKISEINKLIKAGKSKELIKEKIRAVTEEVHQRLAKAHKEGIITDIDYQILLNAINFIFNILYNKINEFKEYEKEVITMIKTLTRKEKEQIEKEGIEKGREEIAIKLIKKNYKVIEISEITGLSLERIKELEKRIK